MSWNLLCKPGSLQTHKRSVSQLLRLIPCATTAPANPDLLKWDPAPVWTTSSAGTFRRESHETGRSYRVLVPKSWLHQQHREQGTMLNSPSLPNFGHRKESSHCGAKQEAQSNFRSPYTLTFTSHRLVPATSATRTV